jgi:hypothetical protein
VDQSKAEVRESVRENLSVSVSAKLQAVAGPKEGVALSATADSKTATDGTISVSARTAGGAVPSASASATVNLDVGPKDIGAAKLTVSGRAGLLGGTVNVGEKGVNGQVSFGPQLGYSISKGVGGSTSVSVSSIVTTLGQGFVSSMQACGGMGGC